MFSFERRELLKLLAWLLRALLGRLYAGSLGFLFLLASRLSYLSCFFCCILLSFLEEHERSVLRPQLYHLWCNQTKPLENTKPNALQFNILARYPRLWYSRNLKGLLKANFKKGKTMVFTILPRKIPGVPLFFTNPTVFASASKSLSSVLDGHRT